MTKRLLQHRKVAEDTRATLDFLPIASTTLPRDKLALAAVRHGKPFLCAAETLERQVMVAPGKFKVVQPVKEKANG
jgi:hypothetical protein